MQNQSMKKRVRAAVGIALSCLVLGAIPGLIEVVFQGIGARAFAQRTLEGTIYALCIGIPCWAIIPRVTCALESRALWMRIAALVAMLGFFSFAGCFAASLILLALHVVDAARFAEDFGLSLRISILITFATGAIATAIGTLQSRLSEAKEELHRRQIAEERERKIAAEARFASLESRVHPHFLFNTLNSIAALVREDPAQAERTIERLAALLRFSLDSEVAGVVTLREELRIVRDYLEIEKVRFGDRLRYRIDGVMQEMKSPPKRLQASIIARLKIQANLSISEHRIPQDGRIQTKVGSKLIDLRVSCLPTNHGESIVMRILDKEGLKLGLPELGFFQDDQKTFERLIALPDGILLVTGPTGSGKTTTLYSCLHFINRPDRKIITVEDPVEYVLGGINQVQVSEAVGLTFAMALRSILRQAPNVVMIGEIRDLETASIAINASLTGHLVFSTLHTNDAPGAVTRLVDIGVKPFLVASSTRCLMAQRLVRKICKKCAGPYIPTDAEMRALGITEAELKTATPQKGRGCNNCNNSGNRGRFGIFEIFVIDDEARKLIYDQVPTSVLRARAREMGMRTLREDGVRKVLAGLTTPEEVIRSTVGDAE